MTYKENNSYFLKCLDLESMGFILVGTDDETYQFKKTENKITIFFSVTLMANKLYGLNSWLVYDEIESMIDSFMDKYQLKEVRRYPMTINFYKLRLGYSYMFEAYNTHFENKEKIDIVVKMTKKNINEEFMPLWEKYADMQVVNDEIIDKIPQMKLHEFISGEMPLKKLVIMSICKNSKYDEYKNWMLGIQEENFLNKIEGAEKDYLLTKDLVEYLETI